MASALKIAHDSANGSEYLHRSCQPPLIHMDVDLEAKIAKSLTKAFVGNLGSHITTCPAGTLGYLDPEYYNTSCLSEKSNLYSCSIVLLELVTGRPPTIAVDYGESLHLAQWARQRLADDDGVESIAKRELGVEGGGAPAEPRVRDVPCSDVAQLNGRKCDCASDASVAIGGAHAGDVAKDGLRESYQTGCAVLIQDRPVRLVGQSMSCHASPLVLGEGMARPTSPRAGPGTAQKKIKKVEFLK